MKGETVNCTSSELSIYLRALAEGYLPISSLDTNPSAQLKSIPIASKSYTHGNKTVSFRGFPYLQMSKSSTANHGEGLSMSSVEAIHAKETATLPAMVFPLRAWELNFLELYRKSNPSALLGKIRSRSEKMLPGLHGGLDHPWSNLGIQPSLLKPEHVAWEVRYERCAHGSSDFRSPNARDWKGMSAKSWRIRNIGDKTPTLPDQIGGTPHPEFAEELMLWPIGWTDLKPLEMDKFARWWNSHGKHFQDYDQKQPLNPKEP